MLQSAYALAQSNGVKTLVYSLSGMGKTVLCSTAPSPVILSAESGLLSLAKVIRATNRDLPVAVIRNIADLERAHHMSLSPQWSMFSTICLDSLTEIAEVVLASEMAKTRDPRKAYGEMITQMIAMVKRFRDIPGKNVYFSCKLEQTKDGATGAIRNEPGMPGQKLGGQLAYLFDEVFQLFVYRDAQGVDHRVLRTQPDMQNEAKDRSGMLAPFEPADLTHIFNKIQQQ